MGFAESLKSARTRAGLTQKEAAEKIGVPRFQYRDWENGLHLAKARLLRRIREVFPDVQGPDTSAHRRRPAKATKKAAKKESVGVQIKPALSVLRNMPPQKAKQILVKQMRSLRSDLDGCHMLSMQLLREIHAHQAALAKINR